MLSRLRVAPLLAELLGAWMWVSVALVMSETTAVAYFIATSVAVALAVSYMVFNSVSGAHFNPAITFGMWTARRITTLRAVGYIVAQMLGGFIALVLYQYLIGHHTVTRTTHFDGKILLAEALGTLVLALGYSAAAYKAFDALQAALTVGAALFVGILIAATASTGLLNPAVALGLRSFGWAYVLGPLVGALVGVNLYNYIFMNAPVRVVKTTRVMSTRKKK
jgi:glycerol uptake facilitator-like aquaporin